MANRDPAPFWRLLLIMALLGVAFWIWLAVALLLPALAEVSAHGREHKDFPNASV